MLPLCCLHVTTVSHLPLGLSIQVALLYSFKTLKSSWYVLLTPGASGSSDVKRDASEVFRFPTPCWQALAQGSLSLWERIVLYSEGVLPLLGSVWFPLTEGCGGIPGVSVRCGERSN